MSRVSANPFVIVLGLAYFGGAWLSARHSDISITERLTGLVLFSALAGVASVCTIGVTRPGI